MNSMNNLYYTKQTISIEVKVNDKLSDNDDYYYIYINDKFIKKYKSKDKVYNYLRYTFGITIMI